MPEHIHSNGCLSLSSDPAEVEGLLTDLEQTLAHSCLDEMSAFQLRCAVIEVVNNCIQHAYEDTPGQPIEVSYRLAANRVQIVVSDRGPAFTGIAGETEVSPLGESGRGLQIARSFVSSLKFERRNGWNRCLLEQRLSV